jgi:hypothetical protein
MSEKYGETVTNGKTQARSAEMKRLIDAKDWDGLDKLLGYSREQDELALREEKMIDAAEVNRRIEELDRIDDEHRFCKSALYPVCRS